MKKLFVFVSFLVMGVMANAQLYLDPTAPLEERVKDALSRMTTREKIQILP